MTALAPTLEAFFVERLINQKDASPRTIAAYRDTLRLLLRYASEQTGKQPSKLDFADLDASLISGFLAHLEHERGNSARTRNARLAAIHSRYRYPALRHPEHAQVPPAAPGTALRPSAQPCPRSSCAGSGAGGTTGRSISTFRSFFDEVLWDLIVRAVEAVTDCRWVLLYVKRCLQAPLKRTAPFSSEPKELRKVRRCSVAPFSPVRIS